MKVKSLSHFRLFATSWTVAYQAPPSTEFSRQEYWSGLPLPSPKDLPNPGIEPGSPALQADTSLSELPGKSYRDAEKESKSTTVNHFVSNGTCDKRVLGLEKLGNGK